MFKQNLVAALVTAGLLLSPVQAAFAQTTVDNTTLKFALVFSRHGVRPPTKTNDAYNIYSSQGFPSWSVVPGNLTIHGAQLMTIMGTYYRQYFIQQGLLTGNDATDVNSEYFYADNAERTFATGQALAAGLLPSVNSTVNEFANSAIDPLFYPVKVNLGSPDTSLAAAALNGRIGANPAALAQAYRAQLAQLEAVLLNTPVGDPTWAPSYLTSIGAMPIAVAPGTAGSIATFSGSIDTASTIAEIFLLEYCEGMYSGNIGWGRLSREQIIDIAKLHTVDFDLLDRTPYLAQAQGSNLLLHIVNTINQAATGTANAHALGAPGQKLVMLTGHDNQLAAVGGLLRADWALPTFAVDDTPPGGAMVFELRQDPAGNNIVRSTTTAPPWTSSTIPRPSPSPRPLRSHPCSSPTRAPTHPTSTCRLRPSQA